MPTTTRLPSLLGAGVLLAIGQQFLAPAAAQACSCRLPFLIAPADGASDVPTNTKIWHLPQVLSEQQGTFRLVGPLGDVAMDEQLIPANGGPGIVGRVFTPRSPLTPGARYRFLVCGSLADCVGGEGFTVGAGRAEAPAKPRVLAREPFFVPGHLTGSCGPDDVRVVKFGLAWEGIALLWDVDGDNDFSPSNLATLRRNRIDRATYEIEKGLPLGVQPCWSWPWPKSASGAPKAQGAVRFGALDLAGNFSGWTDAEAVSLPEGPAAGGGTSVDAAAPADGAAMDDARTPADGPTSGAALPSVPGGAASSCAVGSGGGRGSGAMSLPLACLAWLLARARRSAARRRRFFASH